jgi:hypothetical protein
MRLDDVAKEIRELIQKKQEKLGLTFEENNHIYTMNGRTDYPSVSKVIKKFYDEFPADEVALNMSKGDVLNQQKLLEVWRLAGENSTNLGSRVHFYLEKKLIEMYGDYKEIRQPIFYCDLEQTMKSDAMISGGNKYLELMSQRECVLLDTEMVLGHPELGYTGQPDKVWLTKNRNGDEFGLLITDWKTNQIKNFQVKEYTKSMYHPFDKYPNNALGHYYLQLPLYGKLLLKMLEGTKYENLKLYGCIIVHLNQDGEYSEYRVPKDVIDTVLNMGIKNYLV